MKRILASVAAAALLLPATGFAQSTAPYAVMGYLTTVGCPANQSSCFVQYGATVPISGGSSGSGGGGALSTEPFTPTSATSNISVSTTTSAPANGTALPAGTVDLLIGTTAMYVAFNTTNTTNVTTSSLLLPANTPLVIAPGSNTYVSAQNVSGNGTLTVAGGSITVPVSVAGIPYYNLTSTGAVFVTGITTVATGFSAPATSAVCFVFSEGANGRYRTDGTNPTASVGVPLNNYDTNGAFITLTSNSFTNFKIIAQSGTVNLVADCYK